MNSCESLISQSYYLIIDYIASIYKQKNEDKKRCVKELISIANLTYPNDGQDLLRHFCGALCEFTETCSAERKCILLLTAHLKSINIPLDVRRIIVKIILQDKRNSMLFIWNDFNDLMQLETRLKNYPFISYDKTKQYQLQKYVNFFLH